MIVLQMLHVSMVNTHIFFNQRNPFSFLKGIIFCMVVHVQNYHENEIIMISYYSSVIIGHLSQVCH